MRKYRYLSVYRPDSEIAHIAIDGYCQNALIAGQIIPADRSPHFMLARWEPDRNQERNRESHRSLDSCAECAE